MAAQSTPENIGLMARAIYEDFKNRDTNQKSVLENRDRYAMVRGVIGRGIGESKLNIPEFLAVLHHTSEDEGSRRLQIARLETITDEDTDQKVIVPNWELNLGVEARGRGDVPLGTLYNHSGETVQQQDAEYTGADTFMHEIIRQGMVATPLPISSQIGQTLVDAVCAGSPRAR